MSLSTGHTFAGTSDMAERVRAFDWASTPLGPVEQWPTSLRTTAGVVLQSRFPMLLWWGPELIQLYNDAYRPVLGDMHPQALGARGAEVWAAIWDVIGPQADQVRAGGEATWNEHLQLMMMRRGWLEETYFTFSYSPVPDDDGTVGGVLVTCQETTAEVVDARQLRTLREVGARATDARDPVEACRAASRALARNPADVPFAAVLLLGENGAIQPVAATAHGFPVGPDVLPLERAIRERRSVVVDDLSALGELPHGPWPDPPQQAVILPLSGSAGVLSGLLVVAISPVRALDESYESFLELLADQVGTSVANALAYQAERRHVESLLELDRAKTTFFGNVSHELRTPLTLILGPTEDALVEGGSLSGEPLGVVHRNAARLLDLVNALLDFSRIEAGRMQATFRPTDLAARTREIASGFLSAVERVGLSLRLEVDPADEAAWVDDDLWERIVSNLLSNALKFTREGEIVVRLGRTEEDFRLEVADTGVGVPERELPRLFERFHRIAGTWARTHEGAGIGLAMVRDLVELHGGRIAVDSREGQGSTFTVTIPRGHGHLPAEDVQREGTAEEFDPGTEREAQRDPPAASALRWLPAEGEEVEPAREGSGRQARVLVVDDNADMRAYLARVLGGRWTIELAIDGEAALAQANRAPPDLVLSDVMMPGLDGFGLLERLRANPTTRDVPVILLSARSGEESRVEGLAAGADDYLVKPFSARELVTRVANHLALGALRRRLRAERAAIHDVFSQAPVPICILSGDDLVFELANEAYERFTGRRDLVGRALVEAIPELEGTEIIDQLRSVLRTGQPVHVAEGHIRLVRRPGAPAEDTWWNYVYAPLRTDESPVERVIVVATDVTEQVRARAESEATTHRLEQAERRTHEFLAMLGHELRNPLQPVSLGLALLDRQLHDPDLGATVQAMRGQVGSLARIVDDLLEMSRITHGKIHLQRRPVDLVATVRSALGSVQEQVQRRRHTVRTDLPDAPILVDADPVRLEQIVLNLLTNAAKYTPDGGLVRVRVLADADEVRVEVSDNGRGISSDRLSGIFELFDQGGPGLGREEGGLGIGLTVVRRLVEMHGGTIEARSGGQGLGSTFVVTLPRLPDDASADPGGETITADEASASASLRVLVVDDSTDAAEMLAMLLRDFGHQVRTAHSGAAALDVVEGWRPEVAFLDIGMPGMDGYALARILRARLGEDQLPKLVALTGYGQREDVRRAEEAGFDLHLVKPPTIAQLLDALRQEDGT